MSKKRLVEKRLYLAGNIAHSRCMIQHNYHPEFFKRVLVKLQIKQRDILRQERSLR